MRVRGGAATRGEREASQCLHHTHSHHSPDAWSPVLQCPFPAVPFHKNSPLATPDIPFHFPPVPHTLNFVFCSR